tara:strand:+ start:913 stop:1290 length:378 start_codon:yes stop_codon:yes gene_type:complete
MLQDSIKLIGKKQNPRKDSLLASLKEVDGLIFIYENDFEVWSNFDKWENIFFQRWVFEKALEVYNGKKIDLKCECCEYNYVSQSDFKNSLDKECYGIKTAYMIEKIVDEIILAKARRETDGTYSA